MQPTDQPTEHQDAATGTRAAGMASDALIKTDLGGGLYVPFGDGRLDITPDRTAPKGTVAFHAWRGQALTAAAARREIWRTHHQHSTRWLRTRACPASVPPLGLLPSVPQRQPPECLTVVRQPHHDGAAAPWRVGIAHAAGRAVMTGLTLTPYRRVSGQGQVLDGLGLEIQEDLITADAARHGHALLKWEEDPGITGTVDEAGRPASWHASRQ